MVVGTRGGFSGGRNIHGVQGAEYFGKRPQADLTCHPSYPSRSGKYGLWPPIIFVENDSKNPVSIRLCESADFPIPAPQRNTSSVIILSLHSPRVYCIRLNTCNFSFLFIAP